MYRVFAVEYAGTVSSGGFVQILRSTKKGRGRTFLSKIVLYLSLSALLGAVFRVAAIAVVGGNYVLPALSSSLYSIESFSVVTSDVTIGAYLVLDVLLSMLSAIVLAALFLSLSFFLRKPFAILAVSFMVSALPELIVRTVLPEASDFSVLSLTAPKGVYCRSVQTHLFALDCGYLVLLSVLYLAAAAALLTAAWRRYNGSSAFSAARGTSAPKRRA